MTNETGRVVILDLPKRNRVAVGDVAVYDGDAPAVAAANAEAADDMLDLRREGLEDVTTTPALTLLADGERGDRGELRGDAGDGNLGELGRR